MVVQSICLPESFLDQRLGETSPVAAWLGSRAEVSEVVVSGSELRFAFAGEAAAEADLLGALIAQGVKVLRFAATGSDLQQSYLNTVRAPPPPP